MIIEPRLKPCTVAIIFGHLFATLLFADLQEPPLVARQWEQLTPIEGARISQQTVVKNDIAYVLGGYLWDGNKFELYNDVQYASLKEKQIEWHKAKSFPTPRLGSSSVIVGDFVYVVGGGDGKDYLGDTQYSLINKDGSLGDWTTSKSVLNVPRSNSGICAWATQDKTYLCLVGGVSNLATQTVHLSTVEFSEVQKDGSIGPWKISGQLFKNGRSTPGVAVVGDWIYIVGGWGDRDEDILGDTQRSKLLPNGDLNGWSSAGTSLQTARYGHSLVLFGNGDYLTLMAIGGNAGKDQLGRPVYVDNIEYASITTEGLVGTWRVVGGAKLSPARWGHSGFLRGNDLYLLAGAKENGLALQIFEHSVIESQPAK